MKSQELTFNPTAVQQTIGLRIMNLPQSCTNELIYTQLFQKLKIDTKKVKAFRVRGHKTQYHCLGDAFVYFDSEDSAQDAMHKIIGYELHGQVLNCSLLMPTSDLKLKNDKNVCVANLSSDVTLKTFYQAMQIHGQVLSVYINEKLNKLGKRSGFASYKTVPFAETAQKEGVVINEKKYVCTVLKKQDKNAAKVTTFNSELLSRNIQICFEKPLILKDTTTLMFENQLRNQIQTRFGYTPTSVFVWGNRARHMVEQHQRSEKNFTCSAVSSGAPVEEENGTKFYACYKDGQSCSIVEHNRSIAFVCFDHPKHAQGFMNNYYQSCNGQKDVNQDAYNFTFKFSNGTETLEVNPTSVRPHLKGDKDKLVEIKEYEQKYLPSASDKSFIFFKNLKKDISIQQLTEAIEKNLEGKAKVLSVNMSSPDNETFIRDITKKVTETKFATVHLSSVEESQKLITDFKQNAEFRNKFDLFESYKYANYLAPKKIHKQDLKAKNEKNKRQAQNANKNTNFNFLNMLRFPLNNKMLGFNPMMYKPQFPMQPMMFPRFPNMPFNNINTFPNNNKQFQNAPRGQSVPAPQGQFNNNRPQNNNNMMNNNNKQNYNNYNNNNANRTQSQNRSYNQQQGQQGQQQQRRNPQNLKGTSYPQPQARQHQQDNRKNNAITKPANAPEKKQALVQPAQPPKPIVQPAQPPKPIVLPVPKIEELNGKTDEEKKQILGNCLAPKIQALLSEENKIHAPKVTGMLLDFDVYEVEDIIEMLNKQEELKENIETALELIQESTAQ